MLSKVNFYIVLGEMVFLIGYFGVGKSMLFKFISLMECLIVGCVFINGYDFNVIICWDIVYICCDIGMIF